VTHLAADPDFGEIFLERILPSFAAILVISLIVGAFIKVVRARLIRSGWAAAIRRRLLAIKASTGLAVGVFVFELSILIAAIVGAFALNAWARELGNNYPERGFLAGCRVLCLPVMAVFWLLICSQLALDSGKKMPGPAKAGGTLVTLLTVPGCCGCYPIWPVVLGLLLIVVGLATYQNREIIGPSWKWVALRSFLYVAIYIVAWFQCATAKQQSLRGFGERVERVAGEERLRDWVATTIESRKKAQQVVLPTAVGLIVSHDSFAAVAVLMSVQIGEDHQHLTAEEIPEFVHDLMGHRPTWTRVEVYLRNDDPYVTIFNSSQEAFCAEVRPSRRIHEHGFSPIPWAPGFDGFEWRPGIYLNTAGNFR